MQQIEIEEPKIDYNMREAYKTLRTNLQFCGNDVRIVDITSCTSGEGKSTVARLLAHSLAESGKNVLLLDADMRKSVLLGSLNAHMHGKKVKGLSHFLSGQAKLDDVLYQTNIPGMYLIFSGAFPPNPSELLGNERFHSLLEAARDAFDYVIVDTPPLGSVIDSAVVAPECDGSILVIESDTIGRDFASDVLDQLKRTGCPVLGVVLNRVDIKRGSKYYGKYYGRYYGKYGYGKYGEYGKEEKK